MNYREAVLCVVDENLTHHRWKPSAQIAQMQQQIESDKPAIALS